MNPYNEESSFMCWINRFYGIDVISKDNDRFFLTSYEGKRRLCKKRPTFFQIENFNEEYNT